MKKITLAIIPMALIVLAGCAGTGDPAAEPLQDAVQEQVTVEAPVPSGPKVDWENYAPEVRTRIDAMTDCTALQAEFNGADANDDAQRARTGNGNADLMAYLDARLQENECY